MYNVFLMTSKLCLSRWKRIVLFVVLTSLLCGAAGMLGNYFLYRDKAFDPLVIVVVDEEDSLYSRMAYSLLTTAEGYEDSLIFLKTDREQGTVLLADGTACAMFTIPQGFVDSVMTGENREIQVVYSNALPLKAALVEQFADALLDMLKSSQTGIYTALSYAGIHGTAAEYDTVFREINLRFMRQVLGRDSFFQEKIVSATGQVDAFSHYYYAALVFLLLLGAILTQDILDPLGRAGLHRLKDWGTGSVRISAGTYGSLFVTNALLALALVLCSWAAGLLLGVEIPFRFSSLPGLLLAAGAASAFALGFASLGVGLFSRWAAICGAATLWLFLSGGVIPSVYLPRWIRNLGYATPSYWAVSLLSGVRPLLSTLVLCGLAFLLFCMAVCILAARGKAGKRL